MPDLRVDVWVDPICPFCYVAVERAAWLRERYGAQLHWHPFDLHPEYPPDGIAREELDRRYGPAMREQVRRMITEAGLPLGELPPRVPNSRKAQRVAISGGPETGGALLQRFAEAYWARGLDIGDQDVVLAEATAAGLDPDAVREVLATDAHLDTLRAETDALLEHGAGGVPAWIVDRRALVPGAQPHEVFAQVLERLGHP